MVVYLYRSALVGALGPQLGVFAMIVGVIGGLNWMPTARLVRGLASSPSASASTSRRRGAWALVRGG